MRSNFNLVLVLIWLLMFGIWLFPGFAGAMGGPVPKAQPVGYLIDNFESGNFGVNPAWWVFDKISPEAVSTTGLLDGDPLVAREAGKYSLLIKGATRTEWYAGGMGVYFARPGQDLSQYRNLQMDIYGFGPGQGTLKIELYDDDNNNWDLEQNTMEAYAPLYDDRFAAELTVDWMGWKRVVIPFANLKDENAGVGDDFWNPVQGGKSGGLLQMQFICISSRKIGTLQYAVDNIRLTK